MNAAMRASFPQNKVLKRLAIYIAIGGLFLGLVQSSLFLYEIFGGWAVLLGVLFFPYTLAYLPFYMLLTHGSWSLLLLNYGSVAMSWFLLWIAEKMDTKPRLAIDEPPTQPVVTKENPALGIVLAVLVVVTLTALVYARVR